MVTPCPALEKAKITNPDSQAGIDFCTQKCPYNGCIVFEGDTPYRMKISQEKSRAIQLQKEGMTNREISEILGKSPKTVIRYLK